MICEEMGHFSSGTKIQKDPTRNAGNENTVL